MKKDKLDDLSFKKKTVTNLNKKQLKQIKGGGPSWSCSNLLCTVVSVGDHCTNWSIWCDSDGGDGSPGQDGRGGSPGQN